MVYIHNLSPIAFHILNWPVYWYGLAYLFGFLFCRYWLPRCYNIATAFEEKMGKKMGKKNHRPSPASATAKSLTAKDWDDFLLSGIVATLIGGRLGFILLYHADYYFSLAPNQWWQWLAVWQGGMAFHGAALGLFGASILFCRRHKIKLWVFVDSFTRAVPIALLFGRIANFINGELVGRPIANDFWRDKIGVVFPAVDNQVRYPSQLIESFFEGLLLFILLHFLAGYKKNQASKATSKIASNQTTNMTRKKSSRRVVTHLPLLSSILSTILSFLRLPILSSLRRTAPPTILPNGIIFCGFLFFYGLFRFFIEFLRTPSDGYIGALTAGQFWCAMMMAVGVVLAILLQKQQLQMAGKFFK